MRVAHFDCFSGTSGDMTLGALIDAGVPEAAIADALGSLRLPIRLTVTRIKRNGLACARAVVEAPVEDTNRHLPEIEDILARGSLSPAQLDLATRIFRRLGEAEAAAHGIPIEKVHFHEVGALDSIADIAGAAVGLDLLGVARFTSRGVPPGSGTVKCAHGIMPVPAPATAHLLQGVPLASAAVTGELTTPTGAAILTTVVTQYTDSPEMTIERIGLGAGRKDFWEQPNVLRLLVGTAPDVSAGVAPESDRVWLLETNLDDVSPEVVAYTLERLFAAGALDAWTQPIGMKKNRPGVLLAALAPETPGALAAVEAVIFRETGTLGVRRTPATRSKLAREAVAVDTPFGPVAAKRGTLADGTAQVTPEYEDCARVARERGVPLRVVMDAVRSAAGG